MMLRIFVCTLGLLPFGLLAQFSGGNGDGHDFNELSLSTTGYDASGLFAGGNGDGYDFNELTLTTTGYDASGLFTGGNGDGYDFNELSLTTTGYDASGLFAGGNGDGHDFSELTLTTTGYDASGLFAGGNGDGHDMSEILGVFLPLTLLSFEAIPHEKFVLLKWTTTDEEDTDYFTIEKTRAGHNFVALETQLPAAGSSAPGEQLAYELKDHSPWNGTSYYRLRTTDFDGAFLLSELRKVTYHQAVDWDFSLFPNPNDGRQLSVALRAAAGEPALELNLFTADGQLVLQQTLPNDREDGTFRLNLPGGRLSAGSYVVHLKTLEGEQKTKVLVVSARSR